MDRMKSIFSSLSSVDFFSEWKFYYSPIQKAEILYLTEKVDDLYNLMESDGQIYESKVQ